MDQLRALRYFVKLANTLSFSDTAEHFRIPSSSVSRRIKDLEEALGVALFERTTRSVQLTELGNLYLNEVRDAVQSIEMADELVGAQSQNPTGVLRITAMSGYAERFVLPALNRLRQLYTAIDFDLRITDQTLSLTTNEVDIAIRATSSLPDQLVARHLDDHEFDLVASPKYLAKYGTPKTSQELKTHRIFMYRTLNGIVNWLVYKDEIWRPLDLSPKFITTHGASLLESTLLGDGITFLPRWAVAKHIKARDLQLISLEDGPLSVSGNAKMGIYLLYHPPKFRLQKIRAAVDFLVPELQSAAK